LARKSRKGQQNNPINAQPVYIAGLYARISVNDTGKNTSVLNQIEYIRDFLKQNEDIDVHDIYIDDGVSSFNKNRLAFAKMIDDVRAGKINCVIVNNISRFTRDYIEATEYLEKIFPLLQVRFISLLDGYDSLRGDSLHLAMMLKILLAYSYAKELSIKIEKHFNFKQRAGTYTPARLPYGYRKVQNNNIVEWAIEEETGAIVRRIFEMTKQGASGYSIAKELNSQGIPSPKGTYWTAVSVGRILTNRAYLGEFITHKTKSDLLQNQKAVPLPESQWLYHKEHHAPIIDENLFDLIQQSLAAKEKPLPKGTTTEDFFQGKLYCGVCSRKLKQKKAINGAIYYICPMRDEVGAACNNKSRRAEKLKPLIFSAIKEKIQDEREQREAAIHLDNTLYRKHKEKLNDEELVELKLQSDFQEQLFIRLLEDRYDSGNADRTLSDDLRGLYQHMFMMRKYIAARIDTVEKERFEHKTNRSLKATRMGMYLKYEQISELTPEMLDTLVGRVYILPDRMQVVYKIPEI